MTTAGLRAAVIGLTAFAALEEELLLASAADSTDPGSPERWAAVPLVAHNTEFRCQQVQRLGAIRRGVTPPEFPQIDHRSAGVYDRYRQDGAGPVIRASRQAAADLIDALDSLPDADLLEPARHPWLLGRQLWLQIIVRGFWHPLGHIGDYYLSQGRAGRAEALATQAVAMTSYLEAPAPARGMAAYNLACAQAQSPQPAGAVATLQQAIGLNPDLRANATSDEDLARLRDSGQLDALLAT
jgi:tetratricopeptide (TPR) repeat protein